MTPFTYAVLHTAHDLADLGLTLAGECSILAVDGNLLQVVELNTQGHILDYRNLRYVAVLCANGTICKQWQ